MGYALITKPMRKLNEKQKVKLAVLERKRKVLLDNEQSIWNTLRPVQDALEEIRIAIDEIELENKYGD